MTNKRLTGSSRIVRAGATLAIAVACLMASLLGLGGSATPQAEAQIGSGACLYKVLTADAIAAGATLNMFVLEEFSGASGAPLGVPFVFTSPPPTCPGPVGATPPGSILGAIDVPPSGASLRFFREVVSAGVPVGLTSVSSGFLDCVQIGPDVFDFIVAPSSTCTLTNDVIPHLPTCAYKVLGANAIAAGATLDQFSFTGASSLRSRSVTLPVVPLVAAPACPSINLAQGQAVGVAHFAFPLGDQVTLTENSTSTAPVGIVSNCASSTSVTVNFQITNPEGATECVFVNDSVLVCANKIVDPNGVAAGFNSSHFDLTGFSLMADAPTVPLECEGQVAFAVRPGVPYKINETPSSTAPVDTAARIGRVSATCGGVAPDPVSDTWTAPTNGAVVNCTVVNDSVLVCVNKYVGNEASNFYGPDSFSFSWSVVDGASGAVSPNPAHDQCETNTDQDLDTAGGAFYIAPGGTLAVTEVNPNSLQVGLSNLRCTTSVPGDEVPIVVNIPGDLATGSVSGVPVPNEGRVDCYFFNNSVIVCISKTIGDGALLLGDLVTDPWIFQVQTQMQFPAAQDLNGCDGIGFVVAANQQFKVFETIRADLTSQVGLTDARCFVGESDPLLPDEFGDITVPAVVDGGRVDCTFTNDTLVVCVAKVLNEVAADIADPGDFTFDFTPAGGSTIQLNPVASDPLCGDAESDNSAVVGIALVPETTFSITEGDPGPQAGLTSARCVADGEEIAELGFNDLATRTLDGVVGTSGVVECTFTNESVLVCVTKEFGEAAGEAAQTTPGTFTATANGAVVAQDITPAVADVENPCFNESDDLQMALYVPPRSSVVLTETLPSDSPLALTEAECEWVAEDSIPLVTTLDGNSASFTHAEARRLDCTLTNDALAVCLVKVLGPNSLDAGFLASEFGFSVTSTDSPVTETGLPCFRDDTDDRKSLLFLLKPDAGFTATETSSLDANAPIGLANISCQAGDETPTTDLAAGTVTLTAEHGASDIRCFFANETVVVCVAKEFTTEAQVAIAAGEFSLADFSFELRVDGELAGPAVVPGAAEPRFCEQGEGGTGLGGIAEILAKPGTEFSVTELIADDVPADVLTAICEGTGVLFERTASFTPMITSNGQVLPLIFDCTFNNTSVAVTIKKVMVNDDGGTAQAADFLFDVYDAEGSQLKTGLQAGAVFYVAPGATFVVTERAAVGYTSTGVCTDGLVLDQALDAAASVTHTPGTSVSTVACTFTNDDIPPIPVCAMLILEEGDTGFVLADFSLELFKDGALVGQRSAGDAFDSDCEDQADTTAELLPGALVKLADVQADGSTYSFVNAVADPDSLLVFDPSSCTVDQPVAVQALAGPDPVSFTANVGATRVTCVARVNPAPPVIDESPSEPEPRRFLEPTPEPVTVAATAAPAPAPTQVVSTAIAVTGSSTRGVTLPIGFAAIAIGFLALGLDRTRRRL